MLDDGAVDSLTGLRIQLDNRASGGYRTALMEINDEVFHIDLAENPQTRTLGLGNRSILEHNQGMLFIFGAQAQHGIWMKDMNFAIDILWLNKDGSVVHSESNITPETFPEVFITPIASDYVLELPAGTWNASSTISW